MPTHEERIEVLERTTKEHGAALRSLSYEVITIKGLVATQGDATQDLKEDYDLAVIKGLVTTQGEAIQDL